MSIFNQSNDVASLAVYGKSYQDCDSDPFRGRPEGITEKDGVLYGVLKEGDFVYDLSGKEVSHETWAELAQALGEWLGSDGGRLMTIPKKDYDELQAANELLCRILGDHDLLDDYAREYPEMVAAAGFDLEEILEEEEEAEPKEV